ncbi:MAG: hypothetical protein E7316_04485 [Clostridiales bacterium]|nr:hypothetical protein [Clostridiales bacterium]
MQNLNKLTGLLPQLADFLVYTAIAVVTLIGVIKCLLPLWNTTHALRRAIRRLQQDAGNTTAEKPVWQESRFMGRRLRGYWLRFLQNAEQLDRRGLPCNVEDYINDDTVAHGPGNANLAELLPNMLTSLGILGTFMGMVRGIGGLNFANSDAIIEGIPTLLSGMRFAFGTSVAGVSCSIIFSMLNRIAQGSSYRAIDDFVESFTQLAMQRPLDNDVQLICQNQDSNHMLSTLTDTLPGQLAKSMEISVSRAMQPVAQSMDSFLIGATRAQVDGVGRIVNSFVNQMNASLNNEFLELGRTLTEINQNQQLTMERMDQSLQSASVIVGEVTRLQGVSQEVMTHFENYVRELSDARSRDERFEQASADLLSRMHQAADQQTEAIHHLMGYQNDLTASLEQFRTQTRDAIGAMQHETDLTGGHLEAVGKTMQTSSTQLAQSYQGFVQNVVEGLSRALGMFDENMNSLVATLTEKVDAVTASGTSGQTAAQLSEIQRMLTSMQASLKQAANSLDQKEA